MTDDWLRDVAGAHRTTVARWRAAQRLPKAVSLLVRIMHHGELELVHDAWQGFRLDERTGTLWTPEGWPCSPGDILAIRYRIEQLLELERELASQILDRHDAAPVRLPADHVEPDDEQHAEKEQLPVAIPHGLEAPDRDDQKSHDERGQERERSNHERFGGRRVAGGRDRLAVALDDHRRFDAQRVENPRPAAAAVDRDRGAEIGFELRRDRPTRRVRAGELEQRVDDLSHDRPAGSSAA